MGYVCNLFNQSLCYMSYLDPIIGLYVNLYSQRISEVSNALSRSNYGDITTYSAVTIRSQDYGVKTETNHGKHKEHILFNSFSLSFFLLFLVVQRFSFGFCKGSISHNTLQIALKSFKILVNSLCWDPVQALTHRESMSTVR